jgi:hypothetical protein
MRISFLPALCVALATARLDATAVAAHKMTKSSEQKSGDGEKKSKKAKKGWAKVRGAVNASTGMRRKSDAVARGEVEDPKVAHAVPKGNIHTVRNVTKGKKKCSALRGRKSDK